MEITHDISDFAKLIHIRVWRHYEFILWASDFKHILSVCQPKHKIYHFSSLQKIRLIHSCWYHNTLAPHIHPWIQSIFYTSLWWWIFGVNKLFYEKLCSFAVIYQSTARDHRAPPHHGWSAQVLCIVWKMHSKKSGAFRYKGCCKANTMAFTSIEQKYIDLFTESWGLKYRINMNFWKNIVEAGWNWSIE